MTTAQPISPIQLKEWIVFACERNGIPEFWREIRYAWKNNYSARAGCAKRTWQPGILGQPGKYIYEIFLSTKLMAIASEAEKRETVIHEACHLIVHKLWPDRKFFDAESVHGIEFITTMNKCGYSGNRFHNIDRTTVRKQHTRYRVNCGCINGIQLTLNIINKIRARRVYTCRNCNKIIWIPNEQVNPNITSII